MPKAGRYEGLGTYQKGKDLSPNEEQGARVMRSCQGNVPEPD